jgi:hypothetical protein
MNYKVLNPRGIPEGVHVIRVGEKVWLEGAIIRAPGDITAEQAKDYVGRGLLEVSNG